MLSKSIGDAARRRAHLACQVAFEDRNPFLVFRDLLVSIFAKAFVSHPSKFKRGVLNANTTAKKVADKSN